MREPVPAKAGVVASEQPGTPALLTRRAARHHGNVASATSLLARSLRALFQAARQRRMGVHEFFAALLATLATADPGTRVATGDGADAGMVPTTAFERLRQVNPDFFWRSTRGRRWGEALVAGARGWVAAAGPSAMTALAAQRGAKRRPRAHLDGAISSRQRRGTGGGRVELEAALRRRRDHQARTNGSSSCPGGGVAGRRAAARGRGERGAGRYRRARWPPQPTASGRRTWGSAKPVSRARAAPSWALMRPRANFQPALVPDLAVKATESVNRGPGLKCHHRFRLHTSPRTTSCCPLPCRRAP